MAINRAQLVKELEPGLNALFGLEYNRYENEHAEIFDTETSDRAFEEEVMLSGFGAAPTKAEGSAVSFDDANEAFTARYNHETIALAFSITEEAVEDNLYDRLSSRYTRALARSMAHSGQHPPAPLSWCQPTAHVREFILPGAVAHATLSARGQPLKGDGALAESVAGHGACRARSARRARLVASIS